MSKTMAPAGERLPYLLSKLKAPRVLERLEQTAKPRSTASDRLFRPVSDEE